MSLRTACVAIGCCALAAPALAQTNLLFNPGFETVGAPPDANGPQGWRNFNFARYRSVGDGLGPMLVRTGNGSIELASGAGPTNNFAGYTTDVFNPDTLQFYNPAIVFPGGNYRISGWYAIPADQPLTGAQAGFKLEFRRANTSIFGGFEQRPIVGHTNGQWQSFGFIVTTAQIHSIFAQFPPGPTMVSVLPLRFGDATATGTIFFDDLLFAQAACEADYDVDGDVDPADVALFVNTWFTSLQNSTINGDFDRNGTVEPTDVAAYVNAWFTALTGGCG